MVTPLGTGLGLLALINYGQYIRVRYNPVESPSPTLSCFLKLLASSHISQPPKCLSLFWIQEWQVSQLLSTFLPRERIIKGIQSRYWGIRENNCLLKQKNTKQIMNHKGARAVKDGQDWYGFHKTNLTNLGWNATAVLILWPRYSCNSQFVEASRIFDLTPRFFTITHNSSKHLR